MKAPDLKLIIIYYIQNMKKMYVCCPVKTETISTYILFSLLKSQVGKDLK